MTHSQTVIHMRTKRPVSINNSLCQGICNYNCRLCSVNKSTYQGPKAFQSSFVTSKIIERVKSAGQQGIPISAIHLSGAGEPTVHPEFYERVGMFGEMLRNWNAHTPIPEIAVVTNGSNLIKTDVIKGLQENPITVSVSFPTPVPEAYGLVMRGDAEQGKSMLERVIPGIRQIMEIKSKRPRGELRFNISPPERSIIRRDFAATVDFLTKLASQVGLDHIQLVMFFASTNRSGLIQNKINNIDKYHDFFRKYDGKVVNGVKVYMTTELKRFFPKLKDIFIDLVWSFDYPCLWNGNLFIAADGSSICSNDQAARNPFGNIVDDDISQLMINKERYFPNDICAKCDASPHKMHGSPSVLLFNLVARMRMKLTQLRNRGKESY